MACSTLAGMGGSCDIATPRGVARQVSIAGVVRTHWLTAQKSEDRVARIEVAI